MKTTTIPGSRPSTTPEQLESKASMERAFNLCLSKTRRNIKALADEPKTWSNAVDGDYSKWNEGFFEIGNWTTSFFTGMALLAWQQLEDEYFLQQVRRLAPAYREKVFARHADTHHDLGFLYMLYSVALYKLTGDAEHRQVGLRAADILYQRFNHKGGFIRAWGHINTTEQDNLAIIDCMMNLSLLYWASRESGDHKYHEAAVRHADATLNYFIRPDDSVFHAYRFDLNTGRPLGADNYCGHSVDSEWARGTAWAMYGFALAHKYTGDTRYLEASKRVARKFLSRLDEEVVPVWDFRLNNGAAPIRDSSAAAVAAGALIEIGRREPGVAFWSEHANKLLARLCRDDYLDSSACAGILRNAQVGDGPGRGQNAYTSWGDYFFMEALSGELFHTETWW